MHCLNDKVHQTASNSLQAIRSLSGKGISNITILGPDASIPTGCAVFVVSAEAAVFLEVKGRVDVDVEIKKAQEKLKKSSVAATKQRKLMEADEFKRNASEAVMDTERDKLKDLEAEMRNYEETVAQFEKMKL